MRLRATSVFLILLLCLPLASVRSAAAPGTWTVGGPFGGSIEQIRVSPHDSSVVYVETWRGVFRSFNGGERWQRPGPTWAFNRMRAPTFHPTNPDVLYAGGHNGLYKTSNGGDDWQRVGDVSKRIGISPAAPSTVFAGGDGVVRSRDGGLTWTRVSDISVRWKAVAQASAGVG